MGQVSVLMLAEELLRAHELECTEIVQGNRRVMDDDDWGVYSMPKGVGGQPLNMQPPQH
jgi:hypothetical protein